MEIPESAGNQSSPPGLCGFCLHARRIKNDRDNIFLLCQAHKRYPEMPRYPRLPVLNCDVFEELPNDEG